MAHDIPNDSALNRAEIDRIAAEICGILTRLRRIEKHLFGETEEERHAAAQAKQAAEHAEATRWLRILEGRAAVTIPQSDVATARRGTGTWDESSRWP